LCWGATMRQVRSRAACVAALAAVGGSFAAAEAVGSGDVALAAHSAPAYAQGLDVLPFPGTPDAPPGTPIDFPAVSPSQIAAIKVVGSSTGLHAGRLTAQPFGHGSAFRPTTPFSSGERVSVSAVLRSGAAAEASGAPRSARRLR